MSKNHLYSRRVMPQQPRQLDHSNAPRLSRFYPLVMAGRENPITAIFIIGVLVANVFLGALAIPGSVLVGDLLSPCVNYLLASIGIVSLAWVWSRSSVKVAAIHATCAIVIPYLCNLAVWQIACLTYPH